MTEPRPIRKLDQTLINRIAAGEIIHRPASALKELIENCLDAGATSIKITVKDGGLKLLQIQDNGCGIRKTDLPILAERFTTSKLSTFSDLARIATYGFRGEALASISHVAKLSVVTKTKDASCAWKAFYVDGALVTNKPGRPAEPEPSAGNDGTTVIIENLFYNTPIRLSALRNNSEEYARILDVVTKYAVHNPRVAFMCKKAGSPSPELSTPSNSTLPQTIRLLYGHSIAKELLATKIEGIGGQVDSDGDGMSQSDGEEVEDESDGDGEEEGARRRSARGRGDRTGGKGKGTGGRGGRWTADVQFTNPNYQAKKFVFLLFINHRLVESPRIKRALEGVYQAVMPKGAFPFVYLSLQLDPKTVDVNVHPTKREVHFLDEENITEGVCAGLQKVLAERAASRNFDVQTLLTMHLPSISSSGKGDGKGKGKERAVDVGADDEREMDVDREGEEAPEDIRRKAVNLSGKPKMYSQHKVRTSTSDRTLDSMFPVSNPSHRVSSLRREDPDLGDSQPPSSSQSLKEGRQDDDHDDVSQTRVRREDRRASQNQSQSQRRGTGNENEAGAPSEASIAKTRYIPESECFLTSVLALRAEVETARHEELAEITSKNVFVGIVDLERSLSLIQFSTNLFLVNHAALGEELFYQLGLRQFGDYARLKLEPPPSLGRLVEIAVDLEDTRESSLSKAQLVEKITGVLMSHREMLSEYFSLGISSEGNVQSIPLLLRDYIPNLDNLPSLVMRLGPQVDWSSEKQCFETILRELAFFYTPLTFPEGKVDSDGPITMDVGEEGNAESGNGGDKGKDKKESCVQKDKNMKERERAEMWQVQHVLLPAIRRYLSPPRSLLDGDVVQVASLPDLYKVFERC